MSIKNENKADRSIAASIDVVSITRKEYEIIYGTRTVLCAIATIFIVSVLAHGDPGSPVFHIGSADPIRGTYHAWWIILGLEKDIVRAMVKSRNTLMDVDLAPINWPGWNQDTHPVVMEVGEETDCGPTTLPLLRSNFMEYKFDIPFVMSKANKSKVFNYKQVLYENNKVESVSSRLFYKLNASFADIVKSETSYNITTGDDFLISVFLVNSTWYSPKQNPILTFHQQIMDLPWFGGKGLQTCAQHHYDFENSVFRPANTFVIAFSPSLLNQNFPAYKYSVGSLSQTNLFGTVEVKINFTMTYPNNCNEI